MKLVKNVIRPVEGSRLDTPETAVQHIASAVAAAGTAADSAPEAAASAVAAAVAEAWLRSRHPYCPN